MDNARAFAGTTRRENKQSSGSGIPMISSVYRSLVCRILQLSWRAMFCRQEVTRVSAEDSFEHTLAALHRAALDDAHWLAAAALVNEACGARGHALMSGDGHAAREDALSFFRFCYGRRRRDDWERLYVRDYSQQDERVGRLTRLPEGAVVHTHALYGESERRRSAVYNELMRDMQAQNGLNVRLDGPGGSHIGWVFADSAKDGEWSSDQVAMIERLRPHIRQLIHVRHALVHAGALGASLYEVLDNTQTCVFHLDRRGRIVAANDRARRILQRRDGLFAPGGFLRATEMKKNVELQRILANAMAPLSGPGIGGSMVVRGSSPSSNWMVHVLPVEAELTDFLTQRVGALVLAVSPANPAWIDSDLVALALGLTPTESRLAAMLAAGHSVRDIALALRRKEGTVHWHLNQIFRKQNISRQVELVLRVLSLQPLSDRRDGEQDPPTELSSSDP